LVLCLNENSKAATTRKTYAPSAIDIHHHRNSTSQQRPSKRREDNHAQHTQASLGYTNMHRRTSIRIIIPARSIRPTPTRATRARTSTGCTRRTRRIIPRAKDIPRIDAVIHEANAQISNALFVAEAEVAAGAVEFLDWRVFAALREDGGCVGGYACCAAYAAEDVLCWEDGEVGGGAGYACCAGRGGGGYEGHFGGWVRFDGRFEGSAKFRLEG
jgi:hypothetical protein